MDEIKIEKQKDLDFKNKFINLAKDAFDINGKVISFKKQLNNLFSKWKATGVIQKETANRLLISKETNGLEYAQIKNNPLTISQNVIDKVINGKHKGDIDYSVLENIDEHLKNSALAFESSLNPNKVAVILNEVDNNGNPILVSLSKQINQGNYIYNVNDIATVHGRTNLQATLDKGTVFYKNKNSDNYINNLRLQLPPGVKVITSKQSISQNTDNASGQYSINNNYVLSDEDIENNINDIIDTVKNVGGEVEGKDIILYHATSKENADLIKKNGTMKGKEDGIFFSTKPNGEILGYGDSVIQFKIPAKNLLLDDLFDDEAHFRIPTQKIGSKIDVSKYIINGNLKSSKNNKYSINTNRSVETDNIIKGVRKEFGVTSNANEVGYIDLDGKFIDFSGKQFSGQSNVRLMDHSDLYLDDMNVDYNKYMELGNIRAFPETGGFELITKPNKEQEITLLKYLKTNPFAQNEGSFVGISSPNKIGEYDIASLQFEQDTKPQDILNEALSYFTDNAKFSINNTTVKNRLKPSSYYDYDNLVKMNDINVPNITTHNYSKVSVRDLIDLSRNNAQNYCAILDNQSGSYFIKDIDNNTIRVNYAGLTHTKSNIKGLLDNDRRNLIVNFGEIFNNSIKTNEAYRNGKHSGIYNGVYGSGNDTFVARFIIVYGSLESSNISKLYAAASKKK